MFVIVIIEDRLKKKRKLCKLPSYIFYRQLILFRLTKKICTYLNDLVEKKKTLYSNFSRTLQIIYTQIQDIRMLCMYCFAKKSQIYALDKL